MVLFPNAINTREFSIIASTASSNSEGGKNTAFFSPWNSSSHPSIAVASQSEKEKTSTNNTHLHPCPDSFNPGTQRNSLLRLTSGLRRERGLSISPWLPSSTPMETPPPKARGGKPLGRAQAPCSTAGLIAFSTGLLSEELGRSRLVSLALGFLFLKSIPHQHLGICREPGSQLFLPVPPLEKRKNNS